MERGENRHAGRSLHNITDVFTQPATQKQAIFRVKSGAYIMYADRLLSVLEKSKQPLPHLPPKNGAIFVHSCKARKEIGKRESVTMIL